MKKRKILQISGIVFGLLAVFSGKKIYDLGTFDEQQGTCPDQSVFSIVAKLGESKMKLFLEDSGLSFSQRGGYINDASCLNKTLVAGIVEVRSEKDVVDALEFARETGLKISIAGQQHSMGGQSFLPGALVLDMKGLKQIEILDGNRVRVGAGALWADLQKVLDQKGYAVKAMQSINIFTIGGTVSVNAHGIAHDPGAVNSTIRAMKIVMPNGDLKRISRQEDAELFRHVIGGYGLFGVIVEVELDIVPNEIYEKEVQYLDYQSFENFYQNEVHHNPNFALFYARLSIVPGANFLRELAIHNFRRTGNTDESLPLLDEEFHHGNNFLKRAVINFSKTGRFGKWLRWYLEKNHNPLKCLSRNEAMSGPDEVCDVTRNTAMYDSMPYLKNNLRDADILQEYFVPFRNFDDFVDGLREVILEEDPNLLNVTVRVLQKDEDSILAYAREDAFGFVLYFNHDLSPEAQAVLDRVAEKLIVLAVKLDGTFYLPYQLAYSPDLLKKSYPMIGDFFAIKRKYDPEEIIQNKWYQKYGRQF